MRLLDETVQRRITEDLPPGDELRLAGGQSVPFLLIPRRLEGDLRRLEIASDGTAGGQGQHQRGGGERDAELQNG